MVTEDERMTTEEQIASLLFENRGGEYEGPDDLDDYVEEITQDAITGVLDTIGVEFTNKGRHVELMDSVYPRVKRRVEELLSADDFSEEEANDAGKFIYQVVSEKFGRR